MILEFCVNNFLSIKDELKLSFVATTLKESLSEPNDVIPLSDLTMSFRFPTWDCHSCAVR